MHFLRREEASFLQDVPGRSESEVLQEAAQLRLGGGDVDRMPKSGEPAHAYLRLVGIDFPRMQIDDGRLMLACVEVADRAPGHPIRQEAEISPAGNGQAPAENGYRGKGELRDTTVSAGAARAVGDWPPMREARGPGDSVAIVDDGKDAGVIQETGLPKNFEAPERLTHN